MAFDDLYPPPSGHIPVTSVAPKRAHGDVEGVARGGKGSPVYLAHSYPTKVPPEAVAPFIAHYTRPGDLVCDPFAGSGMTGVAARRLGRNAVLSDLSPLAVHLATNVTIGCNIDRVREAARSVLADLAESSPTGTGRSVPPAEGGRVSTGCCGAIRLPAHHARNHYGCGTRLSTMRPG